MTDARALEHFGLDEAIGGSGFIAAFVGGMVFGGIAVIAAIGTAAACANREVERKRIAVVEVGQAGGVAVDATLDAAAHHEPEEAI